MRHETQRWDLISVSFEAVAGGVGDAGLTPTVAIQRKSDGLYLQSGGGSWGAGFATNNMTEVDASNQPGLYEYAVPSGQLSRTAGADGYFVKVVESVNSLLEYSSISVYDPGAVWSEDRTDHVAAGTLGQLLQIVAGLVQYNHRLSSPTYDANGRLLTATLTVYPTGTDAQNQTSALESVDITMTYDGDGNLATLLARE